MYNIRKVIIPILIFGSLISLLIVLIGKFNTVFDIGLIFALVYMSLLFLSTFFLKNYSFVYLFIIFVPLIPLYQRLLDRSSDTVDFLSLLLEIVLGIVVFLKLLGERISKTNSNVKSAYIPLLFLWVFTSLGSIFVTNDILSGLLLYLISIIIPVLFSYYLMSVLKKQNKLDVFREIIKSLYLSVFVFILLGFLLKFYNAINVGELDLLTQRQGSIYSSNGLTASISFFIPLVFLNVRFLSLNKKEFVFILIIKVLILAWIFISLSRLGMLTLIVTFLIYSIFIEKRIKILKIVKLLLGIVILLTIINFIFDDYFTVLVLRLLGSDNGLSNSSITETIFARIFGDGRIAIWEDTFNILKGNYLFGIGYGNYKYYSIFSYLNSHNLFLNILVEQGIFSFVIFLLIIITSFTYNNLIRKHNVNQNIRKVNDFLAISIISYLVYSIGGGELYNPEYFIAAINAKYLFVFFSLQFALYNFSISFGGKYYDSI